MTTDPTQAKVIFGNAHAIDSPVERAAYLNAACGGNSTLRAEVDELLSAVHAAGDFIERPLVEATVIQGDSEQPGTVIGPYKLLEQIGEGGFGSVFRAAQTDPVRREVALKVIKPGMDTREVISRFEAERQALALMDHPHIAKVLDAGATESGHPFFVMELVNGQPITQFCDEQRLDLHQRLDLFRDVCAAVQHAHQKGIIHRDIKPSNVLVTLSDGKPLVKVIDFGVAKALHHKLTDGTLWTSAQQVIGTPLYMSPEQADQAALDIDTRTDVYSLGVLLYELLTGTTPFAREELKQAGLDEIRRILREDEPAKPSLRISSLGDTLATTAAVRQVEPKRLSAFVRGDLDWIVMKSLEKDRDRRYATASAFAEDIGRYLHHEPVEACPPSKLYRFGKYARRNKVVLLAGIAVSLSLIVGTGLATSQALRAIEERDRAEIAEGLATTRLTTVEQQRDEIAEQRDRAEKNYDHTLLMTESLLEKIQVWDLTEEPRMQRHRLELLTTANDSLKRLQQANPQDTRPRDLRLGAVRLLGGGYYEIGEFEEAESYLQELIALLDAATSSADQQHELDQRLYRAHFSYGMLLRSLSRDEEARDQFQLAASGARQKLDSTATLNDRIYFSKYLAFLALQEDRLGDGVSAAAHRVESLRLFGIEVDRDEQLAMTIGDLMVALDEVPSSTASGLLGTVAERQNSLEVRLELQTQIVRLSGDRLRENPNRLSRYTHAYDIKSVAQTLRSQSRHDEAAQHFMQALPILHRLVHNYPAVEDYRIRYEDTVYNLFVCIPYVVKSRPEVALEMLNDLSQIIPEDPRVYEHRGNLYADHLQDPHSALTDYNVMIERAGDDVTASQYLLRAEVYTQLGQSVNAMEDAAKVIELGSQNPALAYEQRAAILSSLDLDDVSEALATLNDLVETIPEDPRVYEHRGNLYANDLQDPRSALADYNVMIELAGDDVTGSQYLLRAEVLTRLGQSVKAEEDVTKASELEPVLAYEQSAATYFSLNLTEDAIVEFDMALDLNPTFREATQQRIDLLMSLRRYRAASGHLDEVIEERGSPAASIFKRRATCRFHLGDFEGALEDLTRAVEIKPEDRSNFTWIRPLEIAACPDEAFIQSVLDLADDVVIVREQHPEALAIRAAYLATLGHFERAEKDVDDAWAQLSVDDSFNLREASYTLGHAAQVFAVRGEIDLAEETLQRAAQFDDPMIRISYGRQYWIARLAGMRGDEAAERAAYRDAAEWLEPATTNEQRCLRACAYRALMLLAAGDDDEYRDACGRHMAAFTEDDGHIQSPTPLWICCLSPGALTDYDSALQQAEWLARERIDPYCRLTLGALQYRAGKYDQAIDTLTPIAESEPADPRVWFFLAMALNAIGDHDAAQQWFERASDWTQHAIATTLDPEDKEVRWDRRLTLQILNDEVAAALQSPIPE